MSQLLNEYQGVWTSQCCRECKSLATQLKALESLRASQAQKDEGDGTHKHRDSEENQGK